MPLPSITSQQQYDPECYSFPRGQNRWATTSSNAEGDVAGYYPGGPSRTGGVRYQLYAPPQRSSPIDPSIPGVRGLNPPKVVHALEETRGVLSCPGVPQAGSLVTLTMSCSVAPLFFSTFRDFECIDCLAVQSVSLWLSKVLPHSSVSSWMSP
jgi:hypothetical protein